MEWNEGVRVPYCERENLEYVTVGGREIGVPYSGRRRDGGILLWDGVRKAWVTTI